MDCHDGHASTNIRFTIRAPAPSTSTAEQPSGAERRPYVPPSVHSVDENQDTVYHDSRNSRLSPFSSSLPWAGLSKEALHGPAGCSNGDSAAASSSPRTYAPHNTASEDNESVTSADDSPSVVTSPASPQLDSSARQQAPRTVGRPSTMSLARHLQLLNPAVRDMPPDDDWYEDHPCKGCESTTPNALMRMDWKQKLWRPDGKCSSCRLKSYKYKTYDQAIDDALKKISKLKFQYTESEWVELKRELRAQWGEYIRNRKRKFGIGAKDEGEGRRVAQRRNSPPQAPRLNSQEHPILIVDGGDDDDDNNDENESEDDEEQEEEVEEDRNEGKQKDGQNDGVGGASTDPAAVENALRSEHDAVKLESTAIVACDNASSQEPESIRQPVTAESQREDACSLQLSAPAGLEADELCDGLLMTSEFLRNHRESKDTETRNLWEEMRLRAAKMIEEFRQRKAQQEAREARRAEIARQITEHKKQTDRMSEQDAELVKKLEKALAEYQKLRAERKHSMRLLEESKQKTESLQDALRNAQ